MVTRWRRWLRDMSLKTCILLTVLVMALTSFGVYYFSFDALAHVLSCTGNYYLTDYQIYSLAGISYQSRMWLVPSMVYEKRIEKMPLVEDASVQKERNGRLLMRVQEKVVIGYYTKNNQYYMLTIDNESIPIEKAYMKTIVHFPLLNGFSAAQRKKICAVFKKNEKTLTRAVIEKIAEMVPYKTSFDKNMIKMTMQDGNVVYTSISSLVMMAKYQAMLTRLEGKNVCLLLDGTNDAIEKIDCDELNGKKTSSSSSKSLKKTDTKQESSMDTQSSDQTTTQDTTQDTTSQDTTTTTDDSGLVLDESTGLYYDSTSGYYMDPYSGTYYVWDDTTQSLQPLSE